MQEQSMTPDLTVSEEVDGTRRDGGICALTCCGAMYGARWWWECVRSAGDAAGGDGAGQGRVESTSENVEEKQEGDGEGREKGEGEGTRRKRQM